MPSHRDQPHTEVERPALDHALRGADPETVTCVFDLGIRASNLVLLEWLPAVNVAWQDGINSVERDALQHRFATSGPATPDAVALLERWLTSRPSDGQFAAGRGALQAYLRALDVMTRRVVATTVVDRCHCASTDAGGWLDGEAVSAAELNQIAAIRSDLEEFL